MNRQPTRRELIETATGVAIGATGLVGVTMADEVTVTDEPTGPAEDAPYTVATAEKSVFAPEVLTVPAGATVTFRGNRYPHTVTSTASLADVATADGCVEPYDGPEEDLDSFDGTRIDELRWEHTIESADDPYHVRLESGGLTDITYQAAGEYPYYCKPHCGSYMVGKIHVVGPPE